MKVGDEVNIYHAWCDLKVGVSDVDFSEGLAKYLDHLRTQGLIESWRLTRRKLGLSRWTSATFI